MSLINDALKKAKQAQKENPNPPAPGIGPNTTEEEEPPPSGGLALSRFLPIAIVAGVLLVLVLGWWAFFKSRHKPVAQTTPPPATNVVARPATNAPKPVAAAPAPKPVVPAPRPMLKLQVIMYSTNRPMAMINNRTVMIGEKVSGYKVADIQSDSVTMVNSNDTMVLTMDAPAPRQR